MLRAMIAMVAILPLAALAQEPDRLALVIGAAAYDQDREERRAAGFIVPDRLDNAVRDADLVGAALKGAGFTVERIENPSKRQLLSAIGHLAGRLRVAGDDAVGVFYFAGHGAQGRPPQERDVDNYLIPIEADLQTEIDLEAEAVGLSRVSAILSSSGAKAVVIVLDACRDFALPQGDRTASTDRGLAEAKANPRTLIAYSTAPGDVAKDGRPGENGPYAVALAQAIREANGARLEDIFYRVRQDVLTITEGDQQPWENSSLLEPVVFGKVEAMAQEPTMPRADPYGGRDVVVFGTIKDSYIAQDFATFLNDYPESPFAAYARNRLELMTGAKTAESSRKFNPPPVIDTSEPVIATVGGRAVPINLPMPIDPDGDPLTIIVRGLPIGGTVDLGGGTEITTGASLPVDQLHRLNFTPRAGFSGDAGSLTLEVDDARGGVVRQQVAIRVAAPDFPSDAVAALQRHAISSESGESFFKKITNTYQERERITEIVIVPHAALAGQWSSRWRYREDDWYDGFATLTISSDAVTIIYNDANSYQIDAHFINEWILIGRYINLSDPKDSTLWIGFVESSSFIKGYWEGGDWDFSRS